MDMLILRLINSMKHIIPGFSNIYLFLVIVIVAYFYSKSILKNGINIYQFVEFMILWSRIP